MIDNTFGLYLESEYVGSEYENAFYHVMNRGRARQMIFHDKRYYQVFLETLGEAQARFKRITKPATFRGNFKKFRVA